MLGLGFTLRAALDVLPESAVVVVAEIFAQVVEWHRGHLEGLGSGLTDPRVRVRVQDVATLLAAGRGEPYDAILLDVDNGPSEWCLPL